MPRRRSLQKERKLTVKIPAGIATGQRLRLSGEGESGGAGGPAGDLYVVMHVQDHSFFHRDGNDLFCEIPLNFSTLALGGEITIPTLEGHDTFKIPEGTQTGTVFRLRGRGMPDVTGRGGRGDLLITVKVDHAEEADPRSEKAHGAAGRDAAEGEIRADAARRAGRQGPVRARPGHFRVKRSAYLAGARDRRRPTISFKRP